MLVAVEPGGQAALRDGRPPRISWISIDGFGALADVSLELLGAGLTVMLGPNEAGKSTVFDFLTAVLFGFPPRKSDARYRAPVHGGRHGGRIGLSDAAGQPWVVERHTTPHKHLAVTRPDGSEGDESDLRRLLGGANVELFRAVFAVDLDDLRRLDGMSSDEVREVIFSSSLLGQRRSAAKAMKELDARRDALVRPRQGGEANLASERSREARRQLAAAREASRAFASMRKQVDGLAAEVVELRQQAESARAALRDATLLGRSFEVVLRRRELERRLSTLATLDAGEQRLLAREPQLGSLAAQLSGHRERLAGYRQLVEQAASVRRSVDRRRSELGGGDVVELAESERFDPSSLGAELRPLVEQVERTEREVAGARLAADRAAEEAGQLEARYGGDAGSGPHLPEASALEERLLLLQELRRWLGRIDELERDLELRRHREVVAESARQAPERRKLAGALAGVALVLAVLAVALLAGRQAPVGAGLLLLAGALGWLAWRVGRLRGDEPEAGSVPGPRSGSEAELAHARGRVDELAGTLVPHATAAGRSVAGVTGLIDETELLLDRRRRLDAERERVRDARDRSSAASHEAGRLTRVAERARADLAAFADRVGLDASLTGTQLKERLGMLAELRQRLQALGRIEGELSLASESILRFEDSLFDLAAHVGVAGAAAADPGGLASGPDPLPEAVVEQTLGEMSAVLGRLATRVRERREAEQAVAACERELSMALGEGHHALELREELDSGRVIDWQERAAEATESLSSLEERYEQAVRDHEAGSRQLAELARSAAVPEWEQRCQELEEELERAVRSFLVVSGARTLLQRTLKRYEEQRQPAVLDRAARHFEAVTEGRYVRLAVDSAPDGSKPSVRALRPDGQHVDATELSRGTMEQLYLCLRLGLAESFAERYLPLPIVLDDVLVNFDPARQEAVARELVRAADRHQVLLLTCHPQLAELVTAAGGELKTKTVRLERTR